MTKTTALTVVARSSASGARARAAQEAVREAAAEHVGDMLEAMRVATLLAEEVAAGGDAYPAGIREAARKFASDASAACNTIVTVGSR